MSRHRTGSPKWLDALARWSAQGEVAPPSVSHAAPLAGAGNGLSRRTVL